MARCRHGRVIWSGAYMVMRLYGHVFICSGVYILMYLYLYAHAYITTFKKGILSLTKLCTYVDLPEKSSISPRK